MKQRRVFMLALLAACACEKKANESGAQAASGATPKPSAALASASPSSAPAKPALSGKWSGSYEAKAHLIEVENSGVREWAKDDGKKHSGSGKLELQIAEDGRVSGKLDGALGELTANGKAENDALRAELVPVSGEGLRGVLIAEKEADALRGSIQASTSDSLTVRKANFELKRQ